MKKVTFLLFTSIIFSQISDNAFLTTESSAMVGSNVAEFGSSNSIFTNPAGLSDVENIQFSTGGGNLYGLSWLPSYYFSANAPIPVLGKVSIGFQQLKTKSGSATLSTEQTLSVGHGLNLQKDKNSQLSFGVVANYVQWDLGQSAGVSGDGSDGLTLGVLNTVTVDIGFIASLREKYRCGVIIKNINSGAIGTGVTRTVLPRRLNAGITYLPISSLSTSISMERLLGNGDIQIKGGLQYSLNSMIDFMMGAQANPNRFGVGAKFKFINQTVTYGLLTHPVLPMTHQLSLGLTL
ncbi:MAG: type IX secretion system membrane protein PorP/SprF [Candidatus Marinimicrobia bacterium]|nr:type IX secretion system membrane protein PorP/SprF [Candidatus Neomarinimicrobiota bacterium]